jgi:hypothetical protein
VGVADGWGIEAVWGVQTFVLGGCGGGRPGVKVGGGTGCEGGNGVCEERCTSQNV